ncbi:MAG TPA: DUF2059 domain-containing protein [Pseudobdellovibrionaceae bacterium]|nr:DUF2059 domain-containing protein [Pseudobdellovibrionaceae bacterium]
MRKTFCLALTALMFTTALPLTAHAQGASSKTAIELFKVMELPNMMKDLTATNTDQLIQSYPALKASRKELEKFFEETVGYAALEADLAGIYASAFTESELKELITFYKTPTGRKSTREMPKLYALGADLGRRKVEARQEELQRIVTQAMQPTSNTSAPAKKKGK